MRPTTRPLRAAVIGLGAMGRHHLRIYDELPDVELVGVADSSGAAVAAATQGRQINGYTRIDELLDRERPEIASIAVPTCFHYDVALRLIERGIHILVEKPIAPSPEAARCMIQAANDAGVRLMVGHIERFNPAIVELRRRIAQAGPIFKISARRMGPFPDRIRDVGVVIDLATHDIDVMRFLLDLPVERLYAQTARRIHTAHEDLLVGTIGFAGGVSGSLDVNWLTPTKVRELTVLGSCGAFHVNYLAQELAFYQNPMMSFDSHDVSMPRGVAEGQPTHYAFERKEALRAELEAFCEYARDGGPCPMPPEDAIQALRIATGLIESGRTGQVVHFHHLNPGVERELVHLHPGAA